LRVRFYGRLSDAIGREINLVAAGSSVAEIRARLASQHPAATEWLGRSRALIAGSVVTNEHLVGESDDLEFLPPVSGG
jgi:molybdopterin converting factor small subunit